MKMTKAASKCAAVLCAVAVMMPAAAMAVPATTAVNGGAIVASAQGEGYSWMTGDQYVAVGEKFTFEVNLGKTYLGSYSASDFTYQWYYSDDQVGGTNRYDALNWTAISGATNYTYSDTMTRAMNMRHFRVAVTNTKTGEVHDDWFGVRTVSCMAVQTKLGTAAIEEYDGTKYLVVPVYMNGFMNNKVSALTFSLKTDKSLFNSAEFDSAIGGSALGNYKDDGEFRYSMYTVMTPMTIGSDYKVGDFVLEIKDGAEVKGTTLALDTETASVTGSDIFGEFVYGTTPVSTTVAVSSTASALTYPTNIQVQYSEEYHQVRFTWDAVPGADKYGIAVYLAGKWRIQTSNITTTSYTSPKNMTSGMTYKVAIAARVNGTWDTVNAIKNAVTITVK